MLYEELKQKDYHSMEKVVLRGSLGAVLFYIVAGIFGYLTFSNDVFK